MRKYKFISHTADIGVEAYGGDERELFKNTAKGMFSVMADLKRVRRREKRDIVAQAQDKESLLVSFLNELLYFVDAENLVFRDFDIKEISDSKVVAEAWGETVSYTHLTLPTKA